jgi:hypothetical protein
VLDFRQQQDQVDAAIALFSGEKIDNPCEIWLVEPAAEVLRKYETAKRLKEQQTKESLTTQIGSKGETHCDAPIDQFRGVTKKIKPGNIRRRHHDGR